MEILLFVGIFYCINYLPSKYKYLAYFSLFAHLCILFTNNYIYKFDLLWNADCDDFLRNSISYMKTSRFSEIYSNGADRYIIFLGYLFRMSIFHNYMFLGQLFIIFTWCVSLLFFARILELINPKNTDENKRAYILFIINPFELFITSSILRDGFQLSLLLIGFFYLMQFLKNKKYSNLISGIIFSTLGCFLHAGISIGLLIFFILVIFYFIKDKKINASSLMLSFYIIFTSIILITLFIIFDGYNYFSKNLDFTLSHIVYSATAYSNNVANGNILSILSTWFNYLFYPFPFLVYNQKALFAWSFGLIRFVLLSFACYSFFKEDDLFRRRIQLLCLIFFFSTTFLFSLFVFNYGTSMRHHILTFWILCIYGSKGFFLLYKNNKPLLLKINRDRI